MTTVTPFGRNILIQPLKEKTVLQSAEGSLCDYGLVVSVGEDVKRVAVGDTIGYTVFGINSLEINGTKHYLVPETDEFVLARIQV